MADIIDPRKIANRTLRRAFNQQARPGILPWATAKAWRAAVMAHPEWPATRAALKLDANNLRKADWQALAWLLGIETPGAPPHRAASTARKTSEAQKGRAAARAVIDMASAVGQPSLAVEFSESVFRPGNGMSDDYARAYLHALAEAATRQNTP